MVKKVEQGNKIILGGDWNVLLDPKLDRLGGKYNVSKNSQLVNNTLHDIMELFNIGDIWRIKNPESRQYTWKRKNPTIKSRLDFWLVSDSLFDSVHSVDIEPSVRSDHSAISLTLKSLNSNKKGKGYWKLNNSFINEADYIAGIINGVETWNVEALELQDPRMTWEYLKYKIRQFSFEYGKDRAKIRREREDKLNGELKTLEKEADQTTEPEQCEMFESQISQVRGELRNIEDKATEGLILRSGATWHEKGEKSNAYFLQLESRNKIKKTMTKLEDETGNTIVDPKAIQNLQIKFYKKLYSTKSDKTTEEIKAYLEQISTKTLCDHDKIELDAPITFEECQKVIKTF